MLNPKWNLALALTLMNPRRWQTLSIMRAGIDVLDSPRPQQEEVKSEGRAAAGQCIANATVLLASDRLEPATTYLKVCFSGPLDRPSAV